jgi:molecular chaperone GrpE
MTDTSEQSQNPEQPEEAVAGEVFEGANNELSELLARLEALSAEVEEQRNRYLRTVADLENYRKRALREKEEVRRFATEGLLGDLIPVVDNLSLGLDAARQHEAGKVFVQGFDMVFSQLKGVFQQHGLEEIKPVDAPFDPNLHEAVAHTASTEVAEGNVIEVVRIGYKLHDRLLRPATVVVSSGAGE